MKAKDVNQSYRRLFIDGGSLEVLLWGVQEANRQFAEARKERRAKFFASLKDVRFDACPCGCGLQGDVCDDHIAIVNARNEQIPF
jgi:hypothetical protein